MIDKNSGRIGVSGPILSSYGHFTKFLIIRYVFPAQLNDAIFS
jgi:hypothetical protein